MSDYVIKGKTSDRDGRLVIIDETDWSVEVDETPVPNWDSDSGNYYAEVTNSKKLVFIRRTDGQIKSYGNVDPYLFWDEKTSDTYWRENPFVQSYLDPVWNGSAWEVTNSGTSSQTAQLMAQLTSDWNENYKPYYAKVEYTLSGGGDAESISFLGDASGRDTVSSASAEDQTSGAGILLLKIWQAKDNLEYLSIRIPAGTTLTITGIYFSKLKFNEYVCDGYSYSQNAFDNATAMTGSEPDFSADLEIYGTTSRIYTEWGSYASSYKYNAATFTVSNTDPLSITVQSSTPANPPKVSIFSDRTTYLIGNNSSGSGWLKSGTNIVTFNWTPPSAGTYAVMVYNDSTLDWGKQCETFTVTIAEGESQSTPGCEGYVDIETAMDNTVSGTKGVEEEWKVDIQSHLGIQYGENEGGTVDVNATAPTAFTLSFMEQLPSVVDVAESYVSDEYWDLGGDGTKNGTGESTTWTAYQYQAGYDWEFYLEHWGGSGDGSWRYNFRPDAVRITFTGGSSGIDFEVQNDGYATIVEGTSISSGDTVTIPLPWEEGGGENADIAFIRFVGPPAGGSFTVTDIEFISSSNGPLEWTVSEEVDSSTNGSSQEVIDSFTPTTSEDWRLLLSNDQLACATINMTVTHSGAAEGSWDNYTDQTYWSSYNGTWTGSGWEAGEDFGNYELSLDAQGGSDGGAWTSSYQPTQCRVFFTGTIGEISLWPYDGDPGSTTNPVSGQAFACSFAHGGDYIDGMSIYSNSEFTVTGIEFSFEAIEYPCQSYTSGSDASENRMYETGDLSSEHRITIEDGSWGAIFFMNLSENGYTKFTVVNEDNPLTDGFTVQAFEMGFPGEYSPIDPGETVFTDNAEYYVDNSGGSHPYIFIAIYNSGGDACEEFSINIADGF